MLNLLFYYYFLQWLDFLIFFSVVIGFLFLLKGADGEDGLPGELGKVGPPVCNLTLFFQ